MKDVYQYNRAENIVTVTSYSYDQKYVVGSLAPVPEEYIEWCKSRGEIHLVRRKARLSARWKDVSGQAKMVINGHEKSPRMVRK
jgi:hypothetical protein